MSPPQSSNPSIPQSLNPSIPLRDGRTVQVRTVRRSDTDLFVGFFDDMSPKNRDFMHGFRFDRENAEAITRDPDDGNWYRVVVVAPGPTGERIVGYCWITPVTGPKPFLGIGIMDEFTNAGLGQGLLRLMVHDARERLGLARVWLGVWSDNPRAMRAYEAVGFREDPDTPRKEFDGRTEVYMVVGT